MSDVNKITNLAGKIAGHLLPLPQAKADEFIRKVESLMLIGVTDISEFGHVKELPEPIKAIARNFVAAGNSIEEFFRINPEIGKPDEFNLSEFEKVRG